MTSIEDFISLNEEEIIKLLPQYSSTKLADMIIVHRYFGLFKTAFGVAMDELSRRRINGDSFDYEKYVEDNLNSLPKLDFQVGDIFSLISSIKGKKK